MGSDIETGWGYVRADVGFILEESRSSLIALQRLAMVFPKRYKFLYAKSSVTIEQKIADKNDPWKLLRADLAASF
jgi:hypothetical protein